MTAFPVATAVSSTRRHAGVVFEFLRYFAASGLALGVDLSLYGLGLRAGLAYWTAALIGFSVGAIVAYVASVRWVFDARSVRNPTLEFGLFVCVGVAGLLLTEALLWVGIGQLGLSKMVAKIGAAGIVFIFNFGVRKAMLFRASAR